MRIFNRRAARIKPILDIHCTWTMSGSTYPEMVRIAMRDGHVVKYVLDKTNPVAIHTGKNGWQVSRPQIVGYKYKENEKPLKRIRGSLKRQWQRDILIIDQEKGKSQWVL